MVSRKARQGAKFAKFSWRALLLGELCVKLALNIECPNVVGFDLDMLRVGA